MAQTTRQISAAPTTTTTTEREVINAKLLNLGSLISGFTPDQSCTLLYELSSVARGTGTAENGAPRSAGYAFKCGITTQIASGCLPDDYISAYDRLFANTAKYANSPVYYPAEKCPVGYEPSCTMVKVLSPQEKNTLMRPWDALEERQTAVGCCPL